MSRSTFAKWDPPLPETRNWIAMVGPSGSGRSTGPMSKRYTAALTAHFAAKVRERQAAKRAKQETREAA